MTTAMQAVIKVPESTYSNRLGTATQKPYEIRAAASLTPTLGKTVYQIQFADGQRMSRAAEDLAKQLEIERAGQDPRADAFFDDLFASGPDNVYRWQWTSTGLRVPAGLEAPKSYNEIIDGKVHDVYHFIVLEGDKEVGGVLVPIGNGQIVTSWNEVHGIARTTTNENLPYDKHTTHWYVNLNPPVDPVSGKIDVAVERRSDWHHDGHGRCLYVYADDARSDSAWDDGFRPVQGSLVLPTFEEIEKVGGDYGRGRRDAMAEVVNDLRTLSRTELMKKYISQ